MKIIAIDYGAKRVGVASTDESGRFALPRIVLPNDENLLDSVLKFKESEGAERIILGDSKNLDGTPNPISEKITAFKEELEKKGVEVIFHPEIFTTVEARRLQGNTDMTDASAAALILKNFLDTMYNNET